MNSYEKLLETKIAKIIKENIFDKKTYFVFNTGIAADSWADFTVSNFTPTIALERFLAWDDFKGEALSVKEKEASSVPGLLRKFFARKILSDLALSESEENLGEERIYFERLINSKYADSALTFSDFISKMLPSLGRWHKLMKEKSLIIEENGIEKIDEEKISTAESRDYLKLYKVYKKFMKEREVFEPCWDESTFRSDGRKFIIFYPELLDDFDDYKEVLATGEKEGSALLVRFSEEEKNAQVKADFYSSMRTELRMTCLKIRRDRKNGFDWNQIALSVPDIENYRPYVERELALYKIPFVMRAGTMLGKSGAGRIFRKIYDCVTSSFAFDAVRSLVLDANLPWANPEALLTLISQGAEHKCFTSLNDSDGNEIDSWEASLNEGDSIKSSDKDDGKILETKKLYHELKKSITAMVRAKSFDGIKKNWLEFKNEFFDSNRFDSMPDANAILARCISKLTELSEIQTKYGLSVSDAFGFFLDELDVTQYQKQQDEGGISVFAYKLSALAAIPRQYIINASQSGISIAQKILPFLTQKERDLLCGEDSDRDESQAYICAYQKDGSATFSVAEEALGSFAIPYATLSTTEHTIPCNAKSEEEKSAMKAFESLEKEDFVKAEKNYLFAKNAKFPALITDEAKEAFKKSFARDFTGEKESDEIPTSVQKFILKKVTSDRAFDSKGKADGSDSFVHLTATEMKDFFPCPRKWILKNVLKVKEDTLDTDLFEKYDAGSITHKILEEYLRLLQKNKEPLPQTNLITGKLSGEENVRKILLEIIEEKKVFNLADAYKNSLLARESLDAQKEVFADSIISFLRWFCQGDEFKEAGKKSLFGGWNIFAVEEGLAEKFNPQNPPAADKPLLQGRFDCLLQSGENPPAFALIDFKNTKSAIPKGTLTVSKDCEKAKLDDFQMPMYIQLWETENSPNLITEARFLPVNASASDKSAAGKIVISDAPRYLKRDDFNFTLKTFNRYAKKMSVEIKSAEYPLNQVKSWENCAGKNSFACDYKAICRTLYNVAGLSIIPKEEKSGENENSNEERK